MSDSGINQGNKSPKSIADFPEGPVSNEHTSSDNDCQKCERKCSECKQICNTQMSNDAYAKIDKTLEQLQQHKLLQQQRQEEEKTALVPATRDQIQQTLLDNNINPLISDFNLRLSLKSPQPVIGFDFGSIQVKTKSSSWSSKDQWRESNQYKILIYTNNKTGEIILMLRYPVVTKISLTWTRVTMSKIILQGKKSGNFMGNRDSKNTHRVDMLCNTTKGNELIELAMDSERYKNLKKVLNALKSGNNYDLVDNTDVSKSEAKENTKEALKDYYAEQQERGPSDRLMRLRTAQATPVKKADKPPPGWFKGGDSRDNKKMSKNTTKKHKRLSKHYTRRKKHSQHKTRKKKHYHHYTHKKKSRHNINKKRHTSIKRRPRHNTRKKHQH